MSSDRQGNRLTGATASAASDYDQALAEFNIYRGDPVGLLEQAVEAAPEFAMAHSLKAHLSASRPSRRATKVPQAIVRRRRCGLAGRAETSHVAALEQLLRGNWTAAAEALDRHNAEHPHDLVACSPGI